MKWVIERLFVGVVLVGLVVAAAPMVRADMTITMETETTGTGSVQKTTTVQYYTATKMRSEMGEDTVSIIDLDKERMITLMPPSKTYMLQTLAQLKQMAAMFAGAKPKIEINKTGEEQEINGYHCTKMVVQIAMMGTTTTMEMWLTKDIELDSAVTDFQKNSYEKFKDIPNLVGAYEALKSVSDEGYFPIKTVTQTKTPMGTMTTTQTVTKVETGDLDESLFEIPEGYKEMKMGPFGGAGSH
jgi:hypothetical protein